MSGRLDEEAAMAGRHVGQQRAARQRARRRGGQGLAEYALILALIALLVLAGLVVLGAYYGPSVGLATPVPSAVPGPSFLLPSPIA